MEHPAMPRRSPQLEAQHITKKYTEEPTAHSTRSKKVPMKSSTQEAIMAHLNTAPWQLAPMQLAHIRFRLKMLIAVLEKDTGELIEYKKIMQKPKPTIP